MKLINDPVVMKIKYPDLSIEEALFINSNINKEVLDIIESDNNDYVDRELNIEVEKDSIEDDYLLKWMELLSHDYNENNLNFRISSGDCVKYPLSLNLIHHEVMEKAYILYSVFNDTIGRVISITIKDMNYNRDKNTMTYKLKIESELSYDI